MIFESDSKQVIDAICGQTKEISWKIEAIIQDIKYVAARERFFKFLFVKREANKVADWISKNETFVLSCAAWIVNPSLELEALLNSDVNLLY